MFYPGAPLGGIQQAASDLVLVSSDSVFFYVHSRTLLQHSSNHFNGLIPQSKLQQRQAQETENVNVSPNMNTNTSQLSSDETRLISLLEPSDLVNVLLHTIYNLDCAHYAPSFECLCNTVKTMTKCGYDYKAYITHKSHLYNVILSHAPSRPLDVYAFAASHGLEELAIATSSHLLSLPLPTLTDKMCCDIGPIYLKRLFFLHLGRVDALKVSDFSRMGIAELAGTN